MSYLGRPRRPWYIAALSATQTTNIAVGNHIEFDLGFGFGGITLSTGAGQANGIFTLPVGYFYAVRTFLGGTPNEGQVDARLVNHPADTVVTNPNGVGSGVMRFADPNSTTIGSPTPSSTVIVDASSAQQVVKVEMVALVTAFTSWAAGCRVFIEVLV